jgi:hypothetical protein
MRILASNEWSDYSSLGCTELYPTDSLLQLYEFCSSMGRKDYASADALLDQLVSNRSFPCIDSLAGIWRWEIAQLRAKPGKEPDSDLNYLLQVLRNYSYDPCW